MNGQSFSKQARLNYLDFYKGICIIFIIITHYSWNDNERLHYLFPFWIDMAVPVFMVITGYVTSLSFQNRGTELKTAYRPTVIICKWLRFIIPFFPIYILQIMANILVAHKSMTIFALIKLFIVGGAGQGSYYFPIMIQTVIVIPLIWYLIHKYYLKGLVVCFIVNIAYECLKTAVSMSPVLYRILVFRYIFILGFGCFLFAKERNNRQEQIIWYIIAGIVGVAYIVLFKFTSLDPIITNQWIGTSVFAVLYIVPIMSALMKTNKVHHQVIELLGKASFNIFLTQMVFYGTIGEIIDRNIPGRALQIVANIVVCSILGVAFYKIENPFTQRIVKAIKGRDTRHH